MSVAIFFNTQWRDLGDLHWVRALLQYKVSIAVIDHFTSSFSDTGENMNLKPNALREMPETPAMAHGRDYSGPPSSRIAVVVDSVLFRLPACPKAVVEPAEIS
jgi:hypothetical protein